MVAEGFAGYFFSFLITFLTVPLFKKIAFKYNILDNPDGKLKNHTTITPYLGGVAVFLGFSFSLWSLYPLSLENCSLFAGFFLLVVLGLYDDLYVLSPFQKIVGQVGACFFFLSGGCFFNSSLITNVAPFFLNYPWCLWGMVIILSLWWMLSIINAFNLIDIMDGLATGTAFIAALFFLAIASFEGAVEVTCLLSAFCGALAAFWFYNAPVASMYLGDTGSLLLGGVFAVIPFKLTCWRLGLSVKAFFVPLFILAIPIIELCTLMVIRLYKRLPVYYGSPHHFISYLKRKGWSVIKILIFSFVIALIMGNVALSVVFFNTSFSLLFPFVAFLLLFWFFLIYF